MNAEQLAVLKRVTYLLASARLVIKDEIARRIATEAVDHAREVIKEAEDERTSHAQQLR